LHSAAVVEGACVVNAVVSGGGACVLSTVLLHFPHVRWHKFSTLGLWHLFFHLVGHFQWKSLHSSIVVEGIGVGGAVVPGADVDEETVVGGSVVAGADVVEGTGVGGAVVAGADVVEGTGVGGTVVPGAGV